MAESQALIEQGTNTLAVRVFAVIIVTAILAASLSFIYPGFISLLSGGTYSSGGAIYDAIYVVLTIATDVLYLFGGGVITFGAILVTIRFIKLKLKTPINHHFLPVIYQGT